MTRSELVDAVYQRHGGISRREAQDLVDLILERLTASLAAGQRVEIPGFGTFEVIVSPARAGRHPITGRRFTVAPTRSLQFRPSKRLRDQVNAPPGDIA